MNEVISNYINKMKSNEIIARDTSANTLEDLKFLYDCAKTTLANDTAISVDDYHEMWVTYLHCGMALKAWEN